MTRYTLHVPEGVLMLPSGVTIGDEFRVAGKVRVTAIAEEQVEVTSYGGKRETVPGFREVTATLQFVNLETI